MAVHEHIGSEYIMKHELTGALPKVWKFDISESGPIVPGGIFFAFDDEWIAMYSSRTYKAFRYESLLSLPSSLENSKQYDLSEYLETDEGGFFYAVTKNNVQALAFRYQTIIII